ncbi:MAG: hypothetical protein FWE59_05095 [Oscillospiraceae bacterium]|nr:hypothetical protein [Oscillospiraceae bacterium]
MTDANLSPAIKPKANQIHSPAWYRLDNAAKIYPAVKTYKWSMMFRLGVLLDEPVDPPVLEAALEETIKRFPTLAVRMRQGLFWYYLEHNPAAAPPVRPDIQNPCQRVKWRENRRFLFRVYYYNRRIACEFFHSLTDGHGGLMFLNTLTAAYLARKGHTVPPEGSILDIGAAPDPEELEDAFSRYANSKARIVLRPPKSYKIEGTGTGDYRFNLTAGIVPADKLLALSRAAGVSVTEYLSALIVDVFYRKQLRERKRQRPVTVQIPVNVRKYFPSKTMRNFTLYMIPAIDPNLGEYTFDEILSNINLYMKGNLNGKRLNAHMSTNMMFERNPIIRAAPLFLKNLVLHVVYRFVGRRHTTTVTNMGRVSVPPEMRGHVLRYEAVLGPALDNSVHCAVISYENKMVITLSNTTEENDIERDFFTRLVKLGIPVKIESNRPSGEDTHALLRQLRRGT